MSELEDLYHDLHPGPVAKAKAAVGWFIIISAAIVAGLVLSSAVTWVIVKTVQAAGGLCP